MAQEQEYVRLFVDEGAPLAQLLLKLKQQRHAQKTYIDTLLAAFPTTQD